MGFFSMLGILQVLEDNGKLSNVHEISGASAGSMIGLFLSIKNPYKVKDILETSLSIDVPNYVKPNLQTFLNKFVLMQSFYAIKLVSLLKPSQSCHRLIIIVDFALLFH